MSKLIKTPSSVFHTQTTNDKNAIPVTLLQQARKTGKLSLCDRQLVQWPEEIYKLAVLHSDTDEIDLEGTSNNCKWWELEPLKYLDLSSNYIKVIPPRVNELDSLITLLLHHNMLGSLPIELGQLNNLVKLDLADNKISELPSNFADLKELRHLNLSHNLFQKLPEIVYDLVLLNSLDFSHNKIEEMSSGIGFLTKLLNLNLSNNNLSSVPPDITNCRALQHLNLSNNKITSEGLPAFLDMSNILDMQFQYNKLTMLPKLRGCSNLKEIYLGFNKIEEITVEELSTLSHLQIINLRNNLLKKLPKELSCLQNLVRLDISYNDLRELPPTLSLLPHLEFLLVEGNSLRTIRRDIVAAGTDRLLKHLKELLPKEQVEQNYNAQFPCTNDNNFPDRFAMRCSKAVNLSSKDLCNIPDTVFEEAVAVPCNIVDLSKNKLQVIPSGVWLLSKTLNDLNLSQNGLKEIPKEISTCLNLRYLNVANNRLESLPEECGSCVRMRELNISFNRFQKIPSCVYDFHNLEILIVNDNKIESLDAESLLQLKILTHFDLSNNNLKTIPPLIGNMTHLRTLGLDGNCLRALRPATLAKGTEAVLAWLRNKIA